MHTGSVPGEYQNDWKPTRPENPEFHCQECGSFDVWYRVWDSDCGGYTDYKYECRGCKIIWWAEGSDA